MLPHTLTPAPPAGHRSGTSPSGTAPSGPPAPDSLQAPDAPSAAAGPARYGDLVARAVAAVQAAQEAAARGFGDPGTARAELAGYERFLRVAGAHLTTLSGLAHTPSVPLRRLGAYLGRLQPPDTSPDTSPGTSPDTSASTSTSTSSTENTGGDWDQAASLLGAAHDLLATHLQATGDHGLLPRTPQAEEQLTVRATEQATSALTSLVLGAAASRRQLTHAAYCSQRRLPVAQRPIDRARVEHLKHTATATEVFAMAALYDLHHDQAPDTDTDVEGAGGRSVGVAGSLAHLEPARVPPVARSTGFATALEALAVLRQLSYDQAHATTPASPASLRDLALLGARFTDPTDTNSLTRQLPAARTGLERLQHAHALDTLHTAHHAWAAASRDLTTTVQGLTKAPAGYGAAIDHLLHADPGDPVLRAAVLAALPRLAREAATTITELGHTGALLTPQRDLNLRRSWQPLPGQALTALADRFRTAGRATALARHADHQLTHPPARTPASDPAPARRLAHLERGRSLEAER